MSDLHGFCFSETHFFLQPSFFIDGSWPISPCSLLPVYSYWIPEPAFLRRSPFWVWFLIGGSQELPSIFFFFFSYSLNVDAYLFSSFGFVCTHIYLTHSRSTICSLSNEAKTHLVDSSCISLFLYFIYSLGFCALL